MHPKNDILFVIVVALLTIVFLYEIGFYRMLRGQVYFTEQKMLSKKILSYNTEPSYVEGTYANIYYTPEDAEFIPTIRRSIDFYYPLLAKDFHVSVEHHPKVDVIVYSDIHALEHVTGVRYYGNVPVGVYYGGMIHIVTPRILYPTYKEAEKMDLFIENGPIVHELTHYFLDIQKKGLFEVWLAEGTALYYEYKYTGAQWREDLQEKSKVISLAALRDHFSMLDEKLAYRRAFDIVYGYVQTYGEAQLQQYIGARNY